ncbi:hypothetical protein JD969_08875 [Planctomycetota bacterium]|nr:hypothetical protein JD969_08875 [Planctomycetota bacterium]
MKRIINALMLSMVVVVMCSCSAVRNTYVTIDCPSPEETGYSFAMTHLKTGETFELPHVFAIKGLEHDAVDWRISDEENVSVEVSVLGEQYFFTSDHPGTIEVQDIAESFERVPVSNFEKIETRRYYGFVRPIALQKAMRAAAGENLERYLRSPVSAEQIRIEAAKKRAKMEKEMKQLEAGMHAIEKEMNKIGDALE